MGNKYGFVNLFEVHIVSTPEADCSNYSAICVILTAYLGDFVHHRKCHFRRPLCQSYVILVSQMGFTGIL